MAKTKRNIEKKGPNGHKKVPRDAHCNQHFKQPRLLVASHSTNPWFFSATSQSKANIRNHITITLGLTDVLLQPVKKFVEDKMKIPGQTWKLSAVPNAKRFQNLNECDDIRHFFTIIIQNASYFTQNEVQVAKKMKQFSNSWAHPSFQLLSKTYTKSLLETVEKWLTILPEEYSEKSRRKLKQLQEYGPASYLQHMSQEEVAKVSSSVQDIDERCSGLVKAASFIFESTIEVKRATEEKKYQISNSKIDWEKMPVACSMLRSTEKSIDGDIQSFLGSSKPTFKYNDRIGLNLKVSSNPFEQGSCRLAYMGRFYKKRFEPSCQENPWFEVNPNVVIKDMKRKDTSRISEDCEAYLEVREYASLFAKKYNDILSEEDAVKFIEVFIVDIEMDGEYKTMEKCLNKNMYKKWSNNGGFVNVSDYEPILDTFSHWTHEISNGQMIVVDLQGEKRNKQFLLTDPAIHTSTGNLFGINNSGLKGINKFFKTHVCNSYCRKLKLTKQQVE